MTVWHMLDGHCTHLFTFNKGFGHIEDILEFRNKTSQWYGKLALALDDKRIAILSLDFKKSSKTGKVKVHPEFKECINLLNPPKYLCETGMNYLVIATDEYLYYYNQSTKKILQPTSPSVYHFQNI